MRSVSRRRLRKVRAAGPGPAGYPSAARTASTTEASFELGPSPSPWLLCCSSSGARARLRASFGRYDNGRLGGAHWTVPDGADRFKLLPAGVPVTIHYSTDSGTTALDFLAIAWPFARGWPEPEAYIGQAVSAAGVDYDDVDVGDIPPTADRLCVSISSSVMTGKAVVSVFLSDGSKGYEAGRIGTNEGLIGTRTIAASDDSHVQLGTLPAAFDELEAVAQLSVGTGTPTVSIQARAGTGNSADALLATLSPTSTEAARARIELGARGLYSDIRQTTSGVGAGDTVITTVYGRVRDPEGHTQGRNRLLIIPVVPGAFSELHVDSEDIGASEVLTVDAWAIRSAR